MELDLSDTLLAGDPRLIDHIVGEVKSKGIFDQFRKECIADVDTKPAYQNLRTRVEGSVNSFLSKQIWKPDLNKNQLRETLRKHIHDASYLDAGVERIVDQVVNPKVYSVFMSQIEDVVYKVLGMERPKIRERNGACGLKDLLPKDLDPVSPESDKNSLKDLSLESVDVNDNLDEKQDDKMCSEQKVQNEEIYDKVTSENGHISSEEKVSDDAYKTPNKTGSNLNLNASGKSDDKIDEEEEDSPTFEPIDIMNLNESNMSNDSHLSGISELTSHRSRSPDFSNELTRDNFDYSNQDSQLSKVSSDSRLSIVTDFGCSNHDLTPIHDASKDEKDKCETKSSKDNYRAIDEFDLSRNKTTKSNFEFAKSKDGQDYKDFKDFKDAKGTKSVSSRENSRDAMDSGTRDKYEHKSSREKSKDSEPTRSKSARDKISSKNTKYYKDRSNEKKKISGHSSAKYDKHSKYKSKDRIDQVKEVSEKAKDTSENLKDNAHKLRDEKPTSKEMDKNDNMNKEAKDLKDLYKEKIRELREKKELTEKEKLNKDKDKLNKENKDRRDSPKDRKSSRKEHKSSSSSSSSSSKNLPMHYHEGRSSKTSAEKVADGKDKRQDSKDKARREHSEKRLSKDSKSKTYSSSRTDLSDKSEKSDLKKASRGEKEDKAIKADTKKDAKAASCEKTNSKKDAKNHLQGKSSDRNEKMDSRKDAKNDSQSKDKKRREDKKSKAKDDHSSLRKNSNDRRSTDRDGSNGSNSKTLQSNSSNSNVTSQKSSSSNLKENPISNTSSETSDSIEETQMKSLHQSNCKLSYKIGTQRPSSSDRNHPKIEVDGNAETREKQKEADLHQTELSSRKRQLSDEEDDKPISGETKIKKPKFAKNIHEAKKLMKIRKQIERQKAKEDAKTEKRVVQEAEQTSQSSTTRDADNLAGMPDDERVQIIEIPDEEYEEPYPEKESSLTLDERSIIMLGAEPCTKDFLDNHCNTKTKLSSMELCIRESLSEIVSNMPLGTAAALNPESCEKNVQSDETRQRSSIIPSTPHAEDAENPQTTEEKHKDDSEVVSSKNEMSKDASVDAERSSMDSRAEETQIANYQDKDADAWKESEFAMQDENEDTREQSTKEDLKIVDYNRTETPNDNTEVRDDNWAREVRDYDEGESQEEKRIKTLCSTSSEAVNATDSQDNRIEIRSSSPINEDSEDCRYFETDNETSEKFFSFLEFLEAESFSLEDIIESMGGQVVSSLPKSMAPPLIKPKRPSSPLSDILVNNSNNNNDGHKQSTLAVHEDATHSVKRRKLFAVKKPRFPSLCSAQQGISNGENFVMPLSPDSDVSATSEKTASSNVIKEEKSRNRSSQRYSSDDLYKPRPLFSSSSRRSRRSNQA